MLPVKAIFGTPCFWGFKVHDLYQHLNLRLWLQPRSLRPSQRLQLTQHLFRMKQVQRRFFAPSKTSLPGPSYPHSSHHQAMRSLADRLTLNWRSMLS